MHNKIIKNQSIVITYCFCLQSLKSYFISCYSYCVYSSINPNILFKLFTFTLSLYVYDFTMFFIYYINFNDSYLIFVFYSKYFSPFIGVNKPVLKSGGFDIYFGKVRIV